MTWNNFHQGFQTPILLNLTLNHLPQWLKRWHSLTGVRFTLNLT